MRIWLIGFLVLFGFAEFLQWLRQLSLPLPIFIVGGAFLALASNYDKLPALHKHLQPLQPEEDGEELPPPAVKVDLPSIDPQPVQGRSISFTIRKPHQPGN